jgi:hypothetical protein
VNWFAQFMRSSAEMDELVDGLKAFASVVAVVVFLYWALSI